MFEEYQICPFTGLRSFTEEESLYFKGREEHIQSATEQLQRNKFLMLTGASGDGKSSLVYAGIIPNARAGFLKSKYTNWCVADFRPERSPFLNLSKAVARQLEISNYRTVESELHHGFSALTDLFKNSKRYVDVESSAWQQADESTRAAMKREAGNLIILVDQFEEFFTNPENYHRGVPSRDSNLVLNLLLETSRIALEEDLPIYVIFTMRSDFIGQCAAFRGLPEYIGFSQFFVPRLNRSQLQQVIEEPAVLSGNKITRRLAERLIHDVAEGVDQLPILQHALNQIWHAANSGTEEMDLVHYAMVGGMTSNDLPDEHIGVFKKWFDKLPKKVKACYHKPSLQNVLDTHANKLFESAAESYTSRTGKTITDEAAKDIIKKTFICLTKIDQSRAVRNRMTLKEIGHIVNRHDVDVETMGWVLNIFREPGNTFVRPFITDEIESGQLKDDDVLDITHESLIRNWALLEEWAQEEYHDYAISLDFEQQLNRWVESGKSNGFLLSIGPLTYFENWYNKVKPNAYWIARYLPEDIEQEKKLVKAKQVLANAREFLKRSARKHVITRTVMRYGPRKIAAVLGIIAVLTLSSFAVRNYFRTQNDYILNSIKEQALTISNTPKLGLEFQVPPLIELLIAGKLTLSEVIDDNRTLHEKIRITFGIATRLIEWGRVEPKKEIFQALTLSDSLLQQLPIPDNVKELTENLALINNYRMAAGLAFYFNPDPAIEKLIMRNAHLSAEWALHILRHQPEGFNDVTELTLALENGINYKIFSDAEVNEILKTLSPFENKEASAWVANIFQRDNLHIRGSQTYGFKYNGLYQELAYLYAAKGNSAKSLQCIDTLLFYRQNYYQTDYATGIDNAANIAAVFHIYGRDNVLDEFVNGYCSRKSSTSVDFYYRLVSRVLIDWNVTSNSKFYSSGFGQISSNLNLKFASDETVSFFYEKLKSEASKIVDSDARNFNLAVIYKNEGAFNSYRRQVRGEDKSVTKNGNFAKAFEFYRKVSRDYLNQSVSVIGISGADQISVPRKFLFLYPDYRVSFHPFEPRNWLYSYESPSFLEYVLGENLFDELYATTEDLKYFEIWFSNYHANMMSRDFTLKNKMPTSTMKQVAQHIEARKESESIDLNLLYLHLGAELFAQNEIEDGISMYKKVKPAMVLNAFQYKGFDIINSYSFEMIALLIANLTAADQFDLAYKYINVFKKEINRSSLYAYASQQVSLRKQSQETAIRLLDSAKVEMSRNQDPAAFQPNRHQVAIALFYLSPDKNSEEAYRVIKNSFAKFQAISRFCFANAYDGNLYKAQEQIPDLISSGDQSMFLTKAITGYNLVEGDKPEWNKYRENEFIFLRLFLPYISESN